jgi:hypothetical protein
MRTIAIAAASAVGAAVIAGGIYTVSNVGESPRREAAAAEPDCEFGPNIPTQACFAAGVIRNVSLSNLQGAAQFCNWKKANPGEWSRLKAYAETGGAPANIVTWFGGHILNDLQAYFATGAPEFIIQPNNAPNICKTPLAPPVVSGVTPSDTDVTVTLEEPPG